MTAPIVAILLSARSRNLPAPHTLYTYWSGAQLLMHACIKRRGSPQVLRQYTCPNICYVVASQAKVPVTTPHYPVRGPVAHAPSAGTREGLTSGWRAGH